MAAATRYYRLWLIIFALMIIVVLGRRFGPDPVIRRVKLPDGTVLQVERATYGKRGTFQPGGMIELVKEKLAQSLPKVWSAKLIKPLPATSMGWSLVATVHTNLDALHIWLTCRDATNGFQPVPVFSAELVDDDGYIFPVTQSGGENFRVPTPAPGFRSMGGPSSDIGWLTFEAFPRNEKRLRLRVFNSSGNHVADFLLANPAPAKPPLNWLSQKLPLAKADGDVTFTLASVAIKTNFAAGNTNFTMTRFLRPLEIAPAFEVSEGGKPSSEWDAVDFELWDSSGNFATKQSGHADSLFLSPKEAAWKLVVKFCGSEHSTSATNTAFALSPVVVPAAGQYLALGTNIYLQGISISVGAIGGPGRVFYTQNGLPLSASMEEDATNESWGSWPGNNYTFQSSHPHLAVNFGGLAEYQWLTVRAVDDQGRETYARETTQSGNLNGSGAQASHYFTKNYGMSLRFLPLDLAPDAKTVSLTFCLHTPRVAEFIFKPPQP